MIEQTKRNRNAVTTGLVVGLAAASIALGQIFHASDTPAVVPGIIALIVGVGLLIGAVVFRIWRS